MGIKVEDKCSSKDELYRIDGLCILSSIGKNYYLRFPDYYPQGQIEAATFTVPSSNIISWSRQNIGMDLPTNYKKDKFCNI
jgi:hypothetical protein